MLCVLSVGLWSSRSDLWSSHRLMQMSLPSLSICFHSPCSRPVEFCHDACCACDSWLISSVLQGPAGPKGEKVRSIVKFSVLEQSVSCGDLFFMLIYRQTPSERHSCRCTDAHSLFIRLPPSSCHCVPVKSVIDYMYLYRISHISANASRHSAALQTFQKLDDSQMFSLYVNLCPV